MILACRRRRFHPSVHFWTQGGLYVATGGKSCPGTYRKRSRGVLGPGSVTFPVGGPALSSVDSDATASRAFVRGRHSTNLYGGEIDADLLAADVGTLRSRLALDGAIPPASAGDKLAFARFIAKVLAIQLMIAGVLFGLPAWWLGAFG